MKIVAVLDYRIDAGGGFNQALNAIVQMHRISLDRFEFEVITFVEENISFLQQLGIAASYYHYGWRDRLVATLLSRFETFQSRLRLRSAFERRLEAAGCDLVYFVAPSGLSKALQRLNYIATVWDICHRDWPEFPEVRDFGEFLVRDRLYASVLPRAAAVIADSPELSNRLADLYGVAPARIIAMPFLPSPFLGTASPVRQSATLDKHHLTPGYFYYPAQFWAHKNHVAILDALILLRQRGIEPRVVFTGKDHGNLSHISDYVARNMLADQVKILGFVDAGDIKGLYEGASALLMPTYFGPTNIPPLEAWSLGIPVIYSDFLKGQVGDAALLVDPSSATSIADAMIECDSPQTRERLIAAGRERARVLETARTAAEGELSRLLEQFASIRRCWGRD
ncbi:hypothetical protein ASE00_15630 [Sphingomonas sp. Root710]|uniref:glycosyltransferase family 4 protein n=1 Tax=Sphingomonas sp. Root710 TaxID=1736594 RepID=UPI0007018E15|nr:glycosyltransferase family 1 protein [Sphingomonas sp. Root710]KRB81405.1 hypothetical protein ASE00_15630 [Sphingomonas sp. Root710]